MSRTKIRTATQTSGKPRRRKWTLQTLTAGIVAAGSLVSLAGPAQAYDENACRKVFGDSLVDVDPFRIDTKYVDFGGLPHSGAGGGAPQADAVVCWSPDRWAIVGELFYDSPPPDYGIAWARVDGAGGHLKFKIEPTPGEVTYRSLRFISPPNLGTEVEVQLRWETPTSIGLSEELELFRGWE